MSLLNEFSTFGIVSALTKAFIQGSKNFRIFLVLNIILLFLGIMFVFVFEIYNHKIIGYILTGLATAIFIVVLAYQLAIEETAVKDEIKKAEERIKENPKEPTVAWELARIKLENYLNRNLSQIQWIFIWTVIIMIAGFVIIGYGIMKAYEPATHLKASIVTTASGLLVEFIGATFLVIYKSTMQQAKEYVNVLERINAVGMSVQILESISKEEIKLQDQTRAEIAKQLLA